MDTNTEEYLNYIIQPSKIAGNCSLERIELYINDINARLDKIKKLTPEYITREVLNDADRFEKILASLYLAYTIKESGVSYILPPTGMSWLLNCNLNP
jgi:hypothetical protein